MAAQDKKISSLTEWVYSNIVDAANIVVAHAGGNYRIAMSAIRQYVLGDREIGGTGSRDIVTTDDPQTLTNKTLSSPKINSTTSITATSEQINTLDGISATTAEINHLTGVTSSIQTQINQIINQLQGITYRIYHYSPGVISGVTSQIINEATLRAEYGISNEYRVNPDSISVSVYKSDSGRWYLLPPVESSASEGVVFFATTTAGASQTVLNSINISLLSSESYRIVINYKVLGLAGV